MAPVAFFVDKRGRNTAIENLKAVMGKSKSNNEIKKIARDSYYYFACSQLDSFWSSNLNKDNYKKIVEIEFEDKEIEKKISEEGAVWVTPHYGNFEWISLVMGFRGVKFLLIAQEFKNQLLDSVFTKNRESSGHTVTGSKGAMLKLFRNLKQGGNVALLNDLCIPPEKTAFPMNQFGFLCCSTLIHAELAKRTGKPLVPALCIPKEDATYKMKFFEPIWVSENDDVSEIAQICWDKFEPYIEENPAPWLWAYKHWRYLPENIDSDLRDKSDYPGYANISKKFNKLLCEFFVKKA